MEREKQKDARIAAVSPATMLPRCPSVVIQDTRCSQMMLQSDPKYRPPTSSVFEVNSRDIMCPSDLNRRRQLFGTHDLREVESTSLSDNKIHSLSFYVQQKRNGTANVDASIDSSLYDGSVSMLGSEQHDSEILMLDSSGDGEWVRCPYRL